MQNKERTREIYKLVKDFKRKYPNTIAFRLRRHAKVISQFIGDDEKILYVFAAQKNYKSYEIVNTNIVVLTDKRLVLATKRIVFGYFFKMITPDLFNDLSVHQGIIWGKVIIDTVKETIQLSNVDKYALPEIENNIMKVMLKDKKKDKKESE